MIEDHREGAPACGFPSSLPAITSVRFFLALGVVFYHLRMAWPQLTFDDSGLVERARLNVDVFFILSGFILTHVYWARFGSGRYSHWAFLAARVARIFPLHILLMALMVGLVSTARLLGAEFDAVRFRFADLPAMLLLVQAWFPTGSDEMRWNAPAWSLSAEWFAYLIFPVFAWFGLKLGPRPWLLIGLSAAVFFVLDATYQALFGEILTHAWLNLGVLRIIPEFLYGVALYHLGRRSSLPPAAAWAAALTSAALLLLLMHLSADDRLIVAAAGPVVLTLALLSTARTDGLLRHPALLAAGEASYALYLVHWPLIVAWKGVADRAPAAWASQMISGHGLGFLLALAIAVSLALHYAWERPAREWLRARRWTKAAPAVP